MRKLAEVQEAKELMNQAIDWSVFKWMFDGSSIAEFLNNLSQVVVDVAFTSLVAPFSVSM